MSDSYIACRRCNAPGPSHSNCLDRHKHAWQCSEELVRTTREAGFDVTETRLGFSALCPKCRALESQK